MCSLMYSIWNWKQRLINQFSVSSSTEHEHRLITMKFSLVFIPLVASIFLASADSEFLDSAETPKATHLITIYHCTAWSSFVNNAIRIFNELKQKIPDRNFNLKLKPKMGEFWLSTVLKVSFNFLIFRIVWNFCNQVGIFWRSANLDSFK